MFLRKEKSQTAEVWLQIEVIILLLLLKGIFNLE